MKDKSKHEDFLSDSKCRLIEEYFDRECGFIRRLRVERLLKRCEDSRRYFDGLGELRRLSQCACESDMKVDLWEAIETRIEQERRTEVLLGQRKVSVSRSSYLSGLGFGWGLSGALAAACLAYLVIHVGPAQSPSASLDKSIDKSGFPQPSSFAMNGSQAPRELREVRAGTPQIIEKRLPIPIEVDWMRSNGHVRMLQDESETSAILWIKQRRQPKVAFRPGRDEIPMIITQGAPEALEAND